MTEKQIAILDSPQEAEYRVRYVDAVFPENQRVFEVCYSKLHHVSTKDPLFDKRAVAGVHGPYQSMSMNMAFMMWVNAQINLIGAMYQQAQEHEDAATPRTIN